MQKAGEGNPNHDERGRFSSGDGSGSKGTLSTSRGARTPKDVAVQARLKELIRRAEAARRAEQARLNQYGAKYNPEVAGFRSSPAAQHQRQELRLAPAWARAEARKGIMQEFVKAEVAKVDEELGLVFGWAITCKVEGEPYFDSQRDHIPEDAMLKAAADFMQNSRAHKVMHTGEQVGDVVFAFPLTTEVAKAMGLTTKHTGLMIAVKPGDPAVLDKFRSGELTGFSIGGQRGEDEDVE